MSEEDELLHDSAEELFESAPCGYLTTRLDGTILQVNRTFEAWTGYDRERLATLRFRELLTPGGRIYHDTHYSPLLQMQGSVREIALDVVRADGSRLPVLVSSVVREDASGRPRVVRTTVFDATDRRRYEQELVRAGRLEREIGLELQRSLLTGELPQDAGIRTEVVYRPSVRGQEVGGDWYDAFWIDEPATVALVVGDVVGRGIGAAAAMGQLRSAVRALASTGLAPGALLGALDGYARTHGVGRMATVGYAELDVAARRVRYACAGHPPPALAEPGRPARLLWEGRSLPLDAHRVEHPRPEATLALGPGSTLVLYSDGLVERRDRLMDAGLHELLAAVERVREDDGTGLAAALAGQLLARAGASDDVCVLAVRLAAG